MENTKIDCTKILHNLRLTLFHIALFLLICVLIYCIGMFTILVLVSDIEIKKNDNIFWLSPFVGLIWAGICCSPCCFGKNMKNLYCS